MRAKALLGEVLVGTVCACLGILQVLCTTACAQDSGAESPTAKWQIARENQRPGSSEWELGNPALEGEIEGYVHGLSLSAGERASVSVSTDETYSFRVFRMGYYDGLGGRLVAEGGPYFGVKRLPPSPDTRTGLVEAGWPVSFELETKDEQGVPWPTGVYLIKLATVSGWESYAVFVLRDDTRDAEVAVQLPTATWQAYNIWGGESLYQSELELPGLKAVKVSFDRPFSAELGFGSGLFLSKEAPLVRWLEERGFDIEYLTSVDVGGKINRLGRHRLVISVGHDEYASLEAMDRLESALANGASLAFLTGNTMYWQVRFEDSEHGPDRIEVCYKDLFSEDPLFGVDNARVTSRFRDFGRPENGLLGVMSTGDSISGAQEWVVKDALPWLYEGTGLLEGDRIPELVGYEWDGYVRNGHEPASLHLVADSPVTLKDGGRRVHNAVVYEVGRALVFSAGTIYFARGLEKDNRVSTMMANLATRAGAVPHGRP